MEEGGKEGKNWGKWRKEGRKERIEGSTEHFVQRQLATRAPVVPTSLRRGGRRRAQAAHVGQPILAIFYPK
jgi:hypothetical protein